MEAANDSDTGWDVSRPHVRLWLTLALGVLGMILFPFGEGFAPSAFDNARGLPLFTWMTAAFLCVWLLHRVDGRRVPRPQKFLMAVVLAMSLLSPGHLFGVRNPDGLVQAGFFWLSFLLLALIAGVSFVRWQVQGDADSCSWKASLLRGLAVAFTAPLLLFASRPVGGDKHRPVLERLSGAILAVLPHVLVAGFALPFFLGVCRYDRLESGLGLPWQSFSVWASLACALLFVLNPWPAQPRISEADHLTPLRKSWYVATLVFAAVVLLLLLVLREFVFLLIFFHPAFIWGGVGCALAVALVPWPEYPALPRLGALPDSRKMGALGTAAFLGMAAVALSSFARGPFLHVVSGELFAAAFDPIHTGGALDQPTLHKWFNLFVFFSAMVLPYVAAARWMGDRGSRLGYWAFVIPTVVLCVCLLSILTLPFYWVIQYIGAEGWTFRRLLGLVYGLTGYAVVLAFLCWAVWPSREEQET